MSRGVLDPAATAAAFTISRPLPAPDLAEVVAHYWVIRWDLRGRPPHDQETLPRPTVNLVLEQDRADVVGVLTRRFHRRIEGRGVVLGVKLHPGVYRGLHGGPLVEIVDRFLPLAPVLGDGVAEVQARLLVDDDPALMRAFEELLRPRVPTPDPSVALVRAADLFMRDHSAVTRVEAVADHVGVGVRSLQRLFREYVGVGPKWVLRWYRLQEAADRLATEPAVDLGTLARELGYFDQAHFARDFASVVGQPPGRFAERCAAGAGRRRERNGWAA